MQTTSLIIFAVALAVASASPGPSVAALVARVEAGWLSLAVFGLSLLAQTFQPVFLVIKWVGVGYLLYLAWKMWHAPTIFEGEMAETDKARSGRVRRDNG